jgi:hypothetical protein
MLLFLDFDGVLHPEFVPGISVGRYRTNTDYFSCLAAFEAVVRKHPSLQIVISSTWRARRSLDELRAFFSHDIARRIIDVTPQLQGTKGNRQREIEAWMMQHHWTGKWLAIDDRPLMFDEDCSNVFFTETLIGLDADAAAALDARLSGIERDETV